MRAATEQLQTEAAALAAEAPRTPLSVAMSALRRVEKDGMTSLHPLLTKHPHLQAALPPNFEHYQIDAALLTLRNMAVELAAIVDAVKVHFCAATNCHRRVIF